MSAINLLPIIVMKMLTLTEADNDFDIVP